MRGGVVVASCRGMFICSFMCEGHVRSSVNFQVQSVVPKVLKRV